MTFRLTFLALCLIISNLVFAKNTPYNTNVLIARGIDPQVLNLAISTYRQKIALTVDTTHTIESEGQTQHMNYRVLFDPFKSYGIDLRVQVPNEYQEQVKDYEISALLDELMGIQLYLQADQLYDPNSFEIESESAQETIISFKFNGKFLPRELKYAKDFKGLVYIKNKSLDKIVVTNQQNYSVKGDEVIYLKKEVYFQPVPLNGGYLVKSIHTQVHKITDDKLEKINIVGIVTSYRDDETTPITYNNGARKIIEDDPNYTTYYVELDRLFPIFGQAARKKGYDLPKPFGVSLITMMQETVMHMNSFKLNGNDLGNLVGGDNAKVVNHSAVVLVRADMWLFPFLNVGLIAGKSQTKSDITLKIFPDLPIGDYITINDAQSDSFIYGGGATVAGGFGDYFATVDLQYITSYTEKADTELTMSIITPIVGYHFKEYGFRALIGAQYQDTKETILANFSGNEVVVGVTSEKWGGLLGVETSFNRNWSGSLMYSYGEDRTNLNLVTSYRF